VMATQTAPISMTRQGRVSVTDLIIENESQNERALAAVEKLMGRKRTPEEDALLKILGDAIERFESKHYSLGHDPTPAEMVAYLLEQRGQSAKDLWPVLKHKGHVSEILSGKRQISKEQAKLLGAYFKLSPAVFI